MLVIGADSPHRCFDDSFSDPDPDPVEPGHGNHQFAYITTETGRSGIPGRPHFEAATNPRPSGRGASWRGQFAEVVGPRIGPLHRLARRVLRSEDLADDAVQEALLSFWLEGKLPPNPDAWLARSVILRSLHLNRSRRRRRDHEGRASSRRPERDPGGGASRPLEVDEVARAIEAALSELPEHLRRVFVLREAAQLDYESIAESLRVPVGTVRSRLHRARVALQGALRDEEAFEAR